MVSSEIIRLSPKTVLDIGIGMGKWGMLAREYTDAWCGRRYLRKDWQTKIYGIEIYPEYRNPVWEIYDSLYIGDVCEVLPEVAHDCGPFDLTIMMDVIEHLPRVQGEKLVQDVVACSKNVILSFANMEQAGICANIHEDHVSKWCVADFKGAFDMTLLDVVHGEVQALMLLKSK